MLKLLNEGLSKLEILEKRYCTVGVNQVNFTINEGKFFVIGLSVHSGLVSSISIALGLGGLVLELVGFNVQMKQQHAETTS